MENSTNQSRKAVARILLIVLVGATNVWRVDHVFANHPVLVEGELDFDGDGLVGVAEDTDNGNDRIFGTITAALGGANGGANQNGRVIIVTSGRFHEQLIVTNANGNTTIEAAPGVEATIDAVGTGDRAAQFPASNNTARQAAVGIVVNSPAARYLTLRNLVVRNWMVGIQITGNSRVALDNCRLEGNVNYGVNVLDSARVSISNSQINSTGFRVAGAVDFPGTLTPNPGTGIAFQGSSMGSVFNSTVTRSFGAGIANFTGFPFAVRIQSVNAFDNNPDWVGIPRESE